MFNLTSSGELKTLNKGELGSKFDDLLDSIIIPAVGESFAYYTNRTDFDQKPRTEYFSPRWTDKFIFVGSPPIAASPTVQVWEDTGIPKTYSVALTAGTNFLIHAEMGALERVGCWAEGSLSVKVTYTGGYLTADSENVPADLKMAAMMQASILFRDRELYGISSRSLEGGSIGFVAPTTLPKAVTMILDRYKLYSLHQ